MYFIARGEMEVTCRNEQGTELFCCIIRPGSLFGEVALVYYTVRSANVIAKNYCTVAQFDKESFQEMKNKFPFMIKLLKRGMIIYQDRWRLFIKSMLLRIEYINRNSTQDFIDELSFQMRVAQVEPGDYIWKLGEK